MIWYNYLLIFVGTVVAGIVNALTGNGSAITLTILISLLGLPPDIANGTNRIGILAGTSTAAFGYYRKGRMSVKSTGKYIWPMLIGAVMGVEVSLHISAASFKLVMGILMIILLVVMVLKPDRWIAEPDEETYMPTYIAIPVFMALGFYGGFIQMGMGIMLLAVMVMGWRFSLSDANAIKVLGVLIFTVYAIARFAWSAKINWYYGGVMAVGQSIGGWLGARFATEYPKANLWTYRLLIVVILFGIAEVFLR